MNATKTVSRILCPVDFTDACRYALELAVSLARRDGSELAVLHVYVPPPPQPEIPALVPPFQELRPKLLSELRTFVEASVGEVPYSVGLATGDPAREIVKTAVEAGAHLIVIGTHNRRRIERFLLGSTAEEVLRRAPCPVLTTCHAHGPRPGQAPADFSRILCAVDLRPSSAHTLHAATTLARDAHAELTVLHVVEGPTDDTLGVLGHLDVPEYRRQLEAEARRQLHAAVQAELGQERPATELVDTGRAYKQILKVAAQQSADLIVMGVHGASAADRLLFGSTAQQVVRAADCPVLTLH